MPRDEDELLYDYSSVYGKIRMFYSRLSWKWAVPGLLLIAIITWAIVADQSQSQPPSSSTNNNDKIVDDDGNIRPILRSRFNDNNPQSPSYKFSKGQLKVVGAENQMSPFQGFRNVPAKLSLRALHLENVLIEAPILSRDLQGCHSLTQLTMEKVSVTGEFSRVYLPNLTDFTHNQHRNRHIDDYKEPSNLKSLLFFNTQEEGEWDFGELLHLPVNISVTIGGTTILEINRAGGFLNLNVHYCEQVLRAALSAGDPSILSHFTQLSMSWCGNITADILPSTLRYLNMNNAVPETEELVKVLEKTRELTEFHAFRPSLCENDSCLNAKDASNPAGPIQLNIASFPPSIRTVSIGKLQLTADLGFVSPITKLSIETCNVTGLDLDSFHLLFANVKRFALFKMQRTEDAYKILEEILKTDAEWILMEKFQRNPVEVEMENFLTGIGVPQSSQNFLIEKTKDTTPIKQYTGRETTDFESHYHRFSLFKFSDIDAYDDYLIWDSKY